MITSKLPLLLNELISSITMSSQASTDWLMFLEGLQTMLIFAKDIQKRCEDALVGLAADEKQV